MKVRLAFFVMIFMSVAGLGIEQSSAQFALKPSDTPQVISLKEAIARADSDNVDVAISKEALYQRDSLVQRALSRYLPSLVLDGTLTFNFPEIKVPLSSGDQAQQSQLYRSMADLLTLTRGMRAGADAQRLAMDQASNFETIANFLDRSRSSSIVINPETAFDAKLTLTQPLFNAEAFTYIENMQLEKRRSEQMLKRAQTTTHTDVARAYFEAMRALSLIRTAQNRLDRTSAHTKRMKEKRSIGLAQDTDVKRLEAELIKSKNDLLNARANHENAIAKLGMIIGEEHMFSVKEDETVGEQDNLAADILVEMALANREDIKAQHFAVKSAEQSEWQSYSKFLPTINALGQVKYTNNTSGFVNKPFTGAILLQASWSLFDGGDRYAQLREKRSQIRTEKIKMRDLVHRVEAEVRGKLGDIALKKERFLSARSSLQLEGSIYADTQHTFQSGLIDVLDLIDAGQRLSDAEVAQENARLDLELAQLELAYFIGS